MSHASKIEFTNCLTMVEAPMFRRDCRELYHSTRFVAIAKQHAIRALDMKIKEKSGEASNTEVAESLWR